MALAKTLLNSTSEMCPNLITSHIQYDAVTPDIMVVPEPAGEFDPVALESSLMDAWRVEGTFAKSIESRRGHGSAFTFLEGPPTANGKRNPSCNFETVQRYGMQMEDNARACG